MNDRVRVSETVEGLRTLGLETTTSMGRFTLMGRTFSLGRPEDLETLCILLTDSEVKPEPDEVDLLGRALMRMFRDDLMTEMGTIAEEGPGIMSLGELLSIQDDKNWVVHNMVARGSITLLASEPKCGKTTLLRNMVRAVSVGDDFLDRTTSPCRVLYVSMDEMSGSFSRHVRRMRGEWGDVHFMFRRCSSMQRNLDAVADWVRAGEGVPSMVVIDTLATFASQSEAGAGNDYTVNVRDVGAIRRLTEGTNATVVVTHHYNKTQGVPSLQRVLGSTGIVSSVDDVLYLTRDEDYRRLTSETGRNVSEGIDVGLVYVEETHEMRVRSEDDPFTERENRAARRREDASDVRRAAIVEYVRTHRPRTKGEITGGVRGNNGMLGVDLRDLIQSGVVVMDHDTGRYTVAEALDGV